MIMMWIWFAVGLIIAFGGCVIKSLEDNIQYKKWNFNAEDLGSYLVWYGGFVSASLLISILISIGLKIINS